MIKNKIWFLKNKSVILLVFVLLLLSIGVSAQEWANPDWEYRKQITIDNNRVYEDFTNFPMIVELDDAHLAANAQTDGDDIFFTDKDGIIRIPHEIESYDDGHLIAWVNVPDLYSRYTTTLGKVIYMYYGNPSAESQEDAEAVWDENYLAVYHLQGTSGTIYDSTSNNNDGTALNGVLLDYEGQINGAKGFDGLNDRIQLPQIFTNEPVFSIEAWMNSGDQQGYAITQWSGSKGAMIQYYAPDEIYQLYENNNSVSRSSSANQWRYVAGTYDGTYATIYRDTSRSSVEANTTVLSWPSQSTYLGGTSSRPFLGVLDEVRFSNVDRSRNYLRTSYYYQRNPTLYISLGELEERVIGVPKIQNPTPQDWAFDIEINPVLQAEIIDLENDSVDWTIELQVGSNWVILNNGTAADGVVNASANTTTVDDYGEGYMWRVTATDPDGSGVTSTMVYSFTTIPAEYAWAVISNPYPYNYQDNVEINPILTAEVVDPNGDAIDWKVYLRSPGSRSYKKIAEGTANGSINISVPTTTVTQYDSRYYWRLEATDTNGTGVRNRQTYRFYTAPPAAISDEYPANNSIYVELNPVLQAEIISYEGKPVNWTVELFNGSDFEILDNGTDPDGSIIVSVPTTTVTEYETDYFWKVTGVTVSGSKEQLYAFTTKAEFTAPFISNPNPANEDTMINYNPTLSADVSDLEGDLMDITFSLFNGVDWDVLQTYTNQPDGRYSASTSGVNDPYTYYLWKVTATDGMLVSEETYTFETRGSSPLTLKWTTDLGGTSGMPQIAPVMGDIDNDGDQELVMQAPDFRIVAVDGKTGAIEWSQYESDTKAVELVDLDNDGTPEVIYGLSGPRVRAVNGDGSIRWTTPKLSGEQQTLHPLAAYDIDGDGYPTIYFASEDKTPEEWSGHIENYTGALSMIDHNGNVLAERWLWHPCWGGVSLADANFDGVFEVYVSDRSRSGGYGGYGVPANGLQAYNAHTLEMMWSKPDIMHSSAMAVLADVLGDDELEVVAQEIVRRGVGILDAQTGEILIDYFNIQPRLPTHGTGTVYDIDKDGNLEIIVSEAYYDDYIGDFVVFDLIDGTRDFHPTFDGFHPTYENFWVAWPPEVGDVTGDGDMEILAATGTQDVATGNYPLIIYDKNFNTVQTIYPGDMGQLTPARVYDIDSDGYNEVVVAGLSGTLIAYNTQAPTPNPAPRTWVQRYSEYRRGAAEYVPPPGPRKPWFKDESPADGSVKVEFNPTLSVDIYDWQRGLIDITFEFNNGSVWQVIQTYPNQIINSYTTYTADTSGITFNYSTEYQWRVIAEDEQGHVNNKTYTFTSRPENFWPEVTNPNPTNQATGVSYLINQLTFRLSDAEDDFMDYYVATNPDIGSGSGTGVSDGTHSIPVSGLEPETTYTWEVNVTDGNSWTYETFTFTTMSQIAPTVSNPNPEDGATQVYNGITELTFRLSDANGELLNYTVTTSPDIGSGNGTGVSTGTRSIDVSNLEPDTTYSWQINVTDGIFLTTETFSFTTSRHVWTRLADMPVSRHQHGFQELNGLLYVVGGMGSSGHLSSMYAYDITSNTWTQKASLPIAAQSAVLRKVNGKLYHIGGYDSSIPLKYDYIYEYDPATDTWTRKADSPTGREDMGGGVADGKIYITGGLLNDGPEGRHTIAETVEVYDPATDIWEILDDEMPDPRVLGDHGWSYDGKIYDISSQNTMENYPDVLYSSPRVDEYDPATNTWTRKADIQIPRCYKEIEEIDGELYVVSGATTSTNDYTDKVEIYDVAADSWSFGPDAPYAGLGIGATEYNGKLYISGGGIGMTRLNYLYSLDLGNFAPKISKPSPQDGGDDIYLGITQLTFKLSDANNDPMDYTVTISPDIGSGSGTGVSNGIYSVSVSGLEPETTYTWYVNVTDGNESTYKTFSFTTREEGGDWGYNDWQYRKYIVIDHTKVSSGLTNFPVVIEFDDADVGAHAQTDGDDILFTSDDGSTKLDHEIEYYNNGNLVAWVNVPFVSSNVDTPLYMYYGNAAAANQENPEAVWDSNYMAVYHLDETSDTVYDSTSNNNDGTALNGVSYDAYGQIDGAGQFDGSDDRIQLPQIFTTENKFTIGGWLNTGDERGYIINQWSGSSGVMIQYYEPYEPENIFQVFVNENTIEKTASTNEWRYIVLTYDGANAKLYLDADTPMASFQSVSWPNQNTYLGDSSSGGRTLLGSLDEIRFSDVARSADYIETSYNNQENPGTFFSLGTEETAGPVDCVDDDGDGYGEGVDCLGADCDDNDDTIYPGASELCDGLDNDCDGPADEDYVSIATECGVGACYATGSTSCVAGSVEDSCTPGAPAADDATCDAIDDDCDGTDDEDYVETPTSCGVGACEATGSIQCVAGSVGDSCTAGSPAAETCNDLDDDCDGSTDEDLTQATSCGVGACAGNVGEETCSAGVWGGDTCDAYAGATTEVCDDIDDDCDGSIECSMSINLYEGWNLISIPLILENKILPAPFESIAGSYSGLFVHNGSEWKQYLPDNGPSSNLEEIDEKMGMWIKMLNDDSLIISGTVPETTTINLKQGWNLIGYPSVNEENVGDVFSGISASLVNVLSYENNTWFGYSPLKPINALEIIKPGYGYWVNVNENVNLII